MSILIKNGRVIDPASGIDDIIDVLISGNRIEKIDKHLSGAGKEVRVIDASGHVVAPGLIDVHTHLREPGYEWKETIKTGTMAAAKGGGFQPGCSTVRWEQLGKKPDGTDRDRTSRSSRDIP